jgi:hypothetical protein
MIETRANFGYMLVGLFILWLLAPVMALVSGKVAQVAIYLALGAALCLGAWSLSRERGFFLIAAGITLVAVVCSIFAYLTGNTFAIFAVLSLQMLFWVMSAWFVGRHVLAPGPVDINRIAGGICIYMIAAIVWALAYTLVYQFIPGAFNGLASLPFEDQLAEMLYFSFVTLTTLGYGDVTPAHPFTRWMAQVEAVFGQLYIAILIASLVGMWIASAASGNVKDNDSQ